MTENTLEILLKKFVTLDKTLTQLRKIGNRITIGEHGERWLLTRQELISHWKKGYTMNEETFRVIWQTGTYQHLENKIEDYFEFVKKYTELYGKPLENDTLMYRADDKPIQYLDGSSWTTAKKSAFNFCGRFSLTYVYQMIIPKGTKTVHFHPTLRYPESEDVIYFPSAKNDSLDYFAKFINAKPLNKGKSLLTFEKKEGGVEFYPLSAQGTNSMIVHMQKKVI